jgi:Ca2+-binding RTX toxin-like protein
MGCRRPLTALGCVCFAALFAPAPAAADHLTPSGKIFGEVAAYDGGGSWTVDVQWAGECLGAPGGPETKYGGHIWMTDTATGERIYVGGFVTQAGIKQPRFTSGAKPRTLAIELIITCYIAFPNHGADYSVTVPGNVVTIPARFAGFGGGGGSGGGVGGGGDGVDPGVPLGPGGCGPAILGTNGPDELTGGDEGEIVVGFAGKDVLDGRLGHDCLIGVGSADRLLGGDGNDRLTGGRGRDHLAGGRGVNAYDAGPGNDRIAARNGKRELVICGSGRDRASADRRDRTRGCELVVAGGR